MSSRSDRKKAGRAWHPARTAEMLGLIERFREYERAMASYPDPYGDLARIKDEFWSAARGALDCVPIALGQACGTRLGKKGKAVLKLEAGDVEAAERMSKLTGYSFEECLKAYSDVNEMNTLSYEGGTLIQKKGNAMTPKERRELEKAAVQYALQHKMTGASPNVDLAVWSLLYKAQRPIGQISTAPVNSSLGLITGRVVR